MLHMGDISDLFIAYINVQTVVHQIVYMDEHNVDKELALLT